MGASTPNQIKELFMDIPTKQITEEELQQMASAGTLVDSLFLVRDTDGAPIALYVPTEAGDPEKSRSILCRRYLGDSFYKPLRIPRSRLTGLAKLIEDGVSIAQVNAAIREARLA
jgi:hypothetical protein